jgi:hypothetical protein
MKTISLVAFVLLLSATARAESVYKYTWRASSGSEIQVMYAGQSGMITEERRLTDAALEDGTLESTLISDFVILPDRMIINEGSEQASMVMDPANMPQMPAFGGAGGAGAAAAAGIDPEVLAQILAETQQALQDAPPEAQQALQGLFGGGGGGFPAIPGLSGQPPVQAQIQATGNSGSTNGMAWEEVQITLMGQTSTYRVADWDDIEGAELVAGHYQNMASLFEQFLSGSPFGSFLQNMQAMPQEIVNYMVSNRKFPIYMQDRSGTRELIEIGSDDIAADRFGARYPVRSLFEGF